MIEFPEWLLPTGRNFWYLKGLEKWLADEIESAKKEHTSAKPKFLSSDLIHELRRAARRLDSVELLRCAIECERFNQTSAKLRPEADAETRMEALMDGLLDNLPALQLMKSAARRRSIAEFAFVILLFVIVVLGTLWHREPSVVNVNLPAQSELPARRY